MRDTYDTIYRHYTNQYNAVRYVDYRKTYTSQKCAEQKANEKRAR